VTVTEVVNIYATHSSASNAWNIGWIVVTPYCNTDKVALTAVRNPTHLDRYKLSTLGS
jgi:hypothetical protein